MSLPIYVVDVGKNGINSMGYFDFYGWEGEHDGTWLVPPKKYLVDDFSTWDGFFENGQGLIISVLAKKGNYSVDEYGKEFWEGLEDVFKRSGFDVGGLRKRYSVYSSRMSLAPERKPEREQGYQTIEKVLEDMNELGEVGIISMSVNVDARFNKKAEEILGVEIVPFDGKTEWIDDSW